MEFKQETISDELLLRPLEPSDEPAILGMWLSGWGPTLDAMGPRIWAKWTRTAGFVTLTGLGGVACASAFLLARSRSMGAALTSQGPATIASVMKAVSQLPKSVIALAAASAAPWLAMRLAPWRLRRAILWRYFLRFLSSDCADMWALHACWSRPEAGREFWVAELKQAGSRRVVGGAAIKAGAALRPLKPSNAALPPPAAAAPPPPSAVVEVADSGAGASKRSPLAPAPAPQLAEEGSAAAAAQVSAEASKQLPPSQAQERSAAASSSAGSAHAAAAAAVIPASRGQEQVQQPEEDADGFTAQEVKYHGSLQPHDALLFRMVVDGTVRRRGIGRALLERMAARAEEAGAGRLLLATANPQAIAFYRACGFQGPTGPVQNVLWRELGTAAASAAAPQE